MIKTRNNKETKGLNFDKVQVKDEKNSSTLLIQEQLKKMPSIEEKVAGQVQALGFELVEEEDQALDTTMIDYRHGKALAIEEDSIGLKEIMSDISLLAKDQQPLIDGVATAIHNTRDNVLKGAIQLNTLDKSSRIL